MLRFLLLLPLLGMLRFLLLLPLLGMSNTCNNGNSPSSPAAAAQLNDAEQTTPQDDRNTWEVNDDGRARIQAAMQEAFFAKLMKSKDYYEGYALFSYGGWSNEGQTMILCKQDGSGDITHIAPNTTKELASHSFTQASLERLRLSLEVGGLQDFTPQVFDGIEYEYVHVIKRDDGNLDVKTRVYMKVPSLAPGKLNPYLQIVAAFNTFKQELYEE